MEEQKFKKSEYSEPNIEIIKFEYTDVIATSICSIDHQPGCPED